MWRISTNNNENKNILKKTKIKEQQEHRITLYIDIEMNSKVYVDNKNYSELMNGDYESYVNNKVTSNTNEINVTVYPKHSNLSDVMISVESELITMIQEEKIKTNKSRTKMLKNKIYPHLVQTTSDEDYILNVSIKTNTNNSNQNVSVCSLELLRNNKNKLRKRSTYRIVKVESKLVTTIIERNFRTKLEKKKIFTTKLEPNLKYK